MIRFQVVLAATCIAAMSGCSSGGGDGTPSPIGPIYCADLVGGTASVNLACTAGSCTSDFHEGAVDGDLDTYAILHLASASAGSVSLRSTAQDGVTYPSGTPAAVVWAIERDGNSTSVVTTLSTYLDGVLQQTSNAGGESAVDGFDREAGRTVIDTNLPFDAIELTYSQSGSTGPIEVRIHEFCTSAN
jgi:hypothetical protein